MVGSTVIRLLWKAYTASKEQDVMVF